MSERKSLCIVLVTATWLLPTCEASAQSPADSAAVMRAIGAALRGEARQVLAGDALTTALAEAAGAQLVANRRDAFPPCSWGHDPPTNGTGFRVGIGRVAFNGAGDTVRVLVRQRCDNAPGYTHDIFSRDFEYQLARRTSGNWRVVGRRLTRIT
jgi:hypothetical protein